MNTKTGKKRGRETSVIGDGTINSNNAMTQPSASKQPIVSSEQRPSRKQTPRPASHTHSTSNNNRSSDADGEKYREGRAFQEKVPAASWLNSRNNKLRISKKHAKKSQMKARRKAGGGLRSTQGEDVCALSSTRVPWLLFYL